MKINAVSFRYKKETVLKEISLEIPKGKITTIIGPNGCGKSTLFQLMTKNLCQAEGTILFEGEDLRKIKLKTFAKQVAIVHQHNTAPLDTLVETIVGYGRIPYMKPYSRLNKQDVKAINWAMEVTGITHLATHALGDLSGGERQRVWLAMALAQQPNYLFLDEPTTYLDIRYQIEILKIIQSLNETYGMTIIMILHDINQAMYYSHHLIALTKGGIVAMGRPQEVITEAYLKAIYHVPLKIRMDQMENQKYVLAI